MDYFPCILFISKLRKKNSIEECNALKKELVEYSFCMHHTFVFCDCAYDGQSVAEILSYPAQSTICKKSQFHFYLPCR